MLFLTVWDLSFNSTLARVFKFTFPISVVYYHVKEYSGDEGNLILFLSWLLQPCVENLCVEGEKAIVKLTLMSSLNTWKQWEIFCYFIQS